MVPQFDGVDAILGDLMNGAAERDLDSARRGQWPRPKPAGIEGFGLWLGAVSPPADLPSPRPNVRKLDRAVFDAEGEARIHRRRRHLAEHTDRWPEREPEPGFDDGGQRATDPESHDTEGLDHLGGLEIIDELDSRESEPSTAPVPLADDPMLLESLEGLESLDSVEARTELVPLADDPMLLESLGDLDRGVFGADSHNDARIQRYPLTARLIPPNSRPVPRPSDERGGRIDVHPWLAIATLILAMFLGATGAAFVFQDRLSQIVAQWEPPAGAHRTNDSMRR